MQELQHLNNRLDTLLKKYSALEMENSRLRSEYEAQAKNIESLKGRLNSAEHDAANVNLGKSVFSNEEREGMRKQIDTVIGDIDKILNALDD